MDTERIIFELALVVIGSAVLSWLAIVAKQPMIVAYIVCGVVMGPHVLNWIQADQFIEAISKLGVVLLLFLAGLVLHPQRLLQLFRKSTPVTLINSAGSFVVGFAIGWLWGFPAAGSICIGLTCMFSSTVLVVKLLPTTTLHQEHMGGLAIGVLILQDLVAVAALVVIGGIAESTSFGWELPLLLGKAVGLIAAAILIEQYVLRRMMRMIDHFDEGIYLLALGWCLANALGWHVLGLSSEAGAFVAGVALARSPISLFLSEGLKVLRDFFLVLFFFTLGVRLEVGLLPKLILPATVLAAAMMIVKPLLFKWMFRTVGEGRKLSNEISIRLGQMSEFGLIIAVAAVASGLLNMEGGQIIQMAALLTIITSSYVVVMKYPTPIGSRGTLHRD